MLRDNLPHIWFPKGSGRLKVATPDLSFEALGQTARHWNLLGSSNAKWKKSRIRETKHLSTDADSSTDTTVGWTKNTQKSVFFEKQKKSSKTQKLKNV